MADDRYTTIGHTTTAELEEEAKEEAKHDPITGEPGAHPLGTGVGVGVGVGVGALQSLSAEPLLRGFGDGAVKSAPLSFVSEQPLLFRRAALVLLRTAIAPLPSKQMALP